MNWKQRLPTIVGVLAALAVAGLTGLYLLDKESVEVADEPDAVENGVVDEAPVEE